MKNKPVAEQNIKQWQYLSDRRNVCTGEGLNT